MIINLYAVPEDYEMFKREREILKKKLSNYLHKEIVLEFP